MKKREQITVTGGRSNTTIDAEVYGSFAVHPPVGADASYWNKRDVFVVTHIPTGYAVCDASKVKARQLAEKLNTTITEGNFTRSDIKAKTKTYQAFVAKAQPLVRELQS